MFDFSKIGDMSKIVSQAREIQKKQEDFQREAMNYLKRISAQLDRVINLLSERGI